MEILRRLFYEKYAATQTRTVRDFIREIDWSNRLIGIKGSRGVGKTTLLMQYIKQHFEPGQEVLYVSLDHFYFSEHRLYDTADLFYKKGGKFLALDEVHKYPGWSVEIKNIYDNMPDLQMVFTGSSLLQLQTSQADLSRRAVMYRMPGLSFREFIVFETGIRLPSYTLNDILRDHIKIAMEISARVKPLHYFDRFLNYGYYPFYLENKNTFHLKLSQIITAVLETDIPQTARIDPSHVFYLKRLLTIIAKSVPFKPNLSNLSSRTGISINTLKQYLKLLNDAEIIHSLYFPEQGINSLKKAEKIYLNNTNLMYALTEQVNKGNLRETFFLNQVSVKHNVYASKEVDFNVDETRLFETGGKSKKHKQIEGLPNAYLVKDDLEIGYGNVIPLWLFGFLY